MDTDHDLMERVRSQDEKAFEELHQRYSADLVRHLQRMVRDRGAAEDLLQELFLLVWSRADQWSGSTLPSWLYRIATNLALNHIRTVRRRRLQPLETPALDLQEEESDIPAWLVDAAALGADTLLERKEVRDRLQDLVDNLPEDKREVMRLIYDAQMEVKEVARELGIPQGTVKSRLHYGRREIGRRWKALGIDWEEFE